MNKKIIWIAVVIILVLGGGAFYFTQKANNANQANDLASSKTTQIMKKKKKSTPNPNKKHKQIKNTTPTNKVDDFSNDEWMLMGYMAYSRKNHNNEDIATLVDDISQELSNGDLSAYRNSNNKYTLSNKYGSVDVQVDSTNVIVTNDGTTTRSKDDLKKTFGSYRDEVNQMAKSIQC